MDDADRMRTWENGNRTRIRASGMRHHLGVTEDINLWTSPEHAQRYLEVAYQIPRRQEGEASLLECVPAATRRILDPVSYTHLTLPTICSV